MEYARTGGGGAQRDARPEHLRDAVTNTVTGVAVAAAAVAVAGGLGGRGGPVCRPRTGIQLVQGSNIRGAFHAYILSILYNIISPRVLYYGFNATPRSRNHYNNVHYKIYIFLFFFLYPART